MNGAREQVPDEAVEELARSLYHAADPFGYDWVELTEPAQEEWLICSRKHLAAAYPAIRKEIESKVRAEERERLGAELDALKSYKARMRAAAESEEFGGPYNTGRADGAQRGICALERLVTGTTPLDIPASEGGEGAEPYTDLSYRERIICSERDRGISREKLAERFEVTPERVAQYENGARRKLANLPLTGERLETLIDRAIRLARSSDRPDLAIRAEVLTPIRCATQHQGGSE